MPLLGLTLLTGSGYVVASASAKAGVSALTRSLAAERAPRPGETLVRLVASFETTAEEIDRLIALCPLAPP